MLRHSRTIGALIGCMVFLFLIDTTAARTPKQTESVSEIPATIATEHILKKIEPEYPAMAKSAHLQGNVTLRVTISAEGMVTDVSVISGHPVLAVAAMNAVKQWQYKPFIVDNRTATVRAIVDVPFSQPLPEAEYKKEQQAAEAYYKQENKCREMEKLQEFAEAEQTCKMGIQLADTLPPSRQLERMNAYRLTGHSLMYQRKFSEALGLYQRELAIAKVAVGPSSAELGNAYHDVALGLHATGDLTQARFNYEKSESTLEQARDHISSEFLKAKYSSAIKSVLTDYALLLRQMGDEPGALAAERKANSRL